MRLGLDAGNGSPEIAAELGIKGVPIKADSLVNEGVKATMAPLLERKLEACQIMAFGYNPLSANKDNLDKQRSIIEKAISFAPETGAKNIIIAGGNYHESLFGCVDARNLTEEALDEVALDLKPLVILAEKQGVYICIKPYLKTVISTPERFLALQKRVGSNALRVCCDVVNFYTYNEMIDPLPKAKQVCSTLAGHYGSGNIKDVKLKEGFHIHIELASLKEGVTNWSEVIKMMVPNIPEDGWLMLEHVLSLEEAKDSLELVRNTADQAGIFLN